jgi:hypothetical protein
MSRATLIRAAAETKWRAGIQLRAEEIRPDGFRIRIRPENGGVADGFRLA